MAWTTADIPDQSGRVAVVTGANGELGLEVARELAQRGGQVVMAARDQAKAEAAVASIRGELPDAFLELQPLDLGSVAGLGAQGRRIDPGRPSQDRLPHQQRGCDGHPRAADHRRVRDPAGREPSRPLRLTAQLLAALLQSTGARVVLVTSTGRHAGRPLDPANPHLRGRYDPWRAYGQSKLANLHFALELDRRFRAAGVRPGHRGAPGVYQHRLQARSVRETGGGRSQRFFHAAVRRFGMTPAQGALPLLEAATDPGAVGGALYRPRWVYWGPPVRRPLFGRSRNRDAMATLWEVSERETGVTFDIKPP
jgi:NAD(P)-dependent dehydrogenase (short-subunit alcohol dehydrogenase family)